MSNGPTPEAVSGARGRGSPLGEGVRVTGRNHFQRVDALKLSPSVSPAARLGSTPPTAPARDGDGAFSPNALRLLLSREGGVKSKRQTCPERWPPASSGAPAWGVCGALDGVFTDTGRDTPRGEGAHAGEGCFGSQWEERLCRMAVVPQKLVFAPTKKQAALRVLRRKSHLGATVGAQSQSIYGPQLLPRQLFLQYISSIFRMLAPRYTSKRGNNVQSVSGRRCNDF